MQIYKALTPLPPPPEYLGATEGPPSYVGSSEDIGTEEGERGGGVAGPASSCGPPYPGTRKLKSSCTKGAEEDSASNSGRGGPEGGGGGAPPLVVQPF